MVTGSRLLAVAAMLLDACSSASKAPPRSAPIATAVEIDAGPASHLDAALPTPETAGTALWVLPFGDTEYDMGRELAIDPDGNGIVAGHFQGSIEIGGTPLSTTRRRASFIIKLGPDGQVKSATSPPGGMGGLASDKNGNLVVIGGIGTNDIDLGGGSIAGIKPHDTFVAKFDPEGKHLWSTSLGPLIGFSQGPGHVWGKEVTVDSAGNVLVTGSCDDKGVRAITDGSDFLLVKLSADGALLWAHTFPSSTHLSGMDVAVDPADNVVVVGYFNVEASLGGPKLVETTGSSTAVAGGPVQSEDGLLVKFAPDGARMWSVKVGGVGFDQVNAVAVDHKGDIAISGGIDGDADLGGGVLKGSDGGLSPFVAKFDASGKHIWSKIYPSKVGGRADALAFDACGRVYFAGFADEGLDLGGGAVFGKSDRGAFVGSLSPEGDYLWSAGYSGVRIEKIVVDAEGAAWIVGWFGDTAEFGREEFESAGKADAFVARLRP